MQMREIGARKAVVLRGVFGDSTEEDGRTAERDDDS
jgi:hypothetical protein